ncbi:carbonate dehydratase, partial [Sphingomonas yabuuchiae]
MREYKQLLLANKAWATELLEEKTDFFQRQTVGQKPDFLWIGCSDSRVTPEQMTMTPPGGMF